MPFHIAADLAAWTRLLGLHDRPDLRDAEPDKLRCRIWPIPTRLARHARKRVLTNPARPSSMRSSTLADAIITLCRLIREA